MLKFDKLTNFEISRVEFVLLDEDRHNSVPFDGFFYIEMPYVDKKV